jgi:sec-independent protein translocase protein TatA
MGSMSVWHWLIFLAVALLLFGGKGKISSIMGDVADGIKSFKKGMQDDAPAVKPDAPKPLETSGVKPVDQNAAHTKT